LRDLRPSVAKNRLNWESRASMAWPEEELQPEEWKRRPMVGRMGAGLLSGGHWLVHNLIWWPLPKNNSFDPLEAWGQGVWRVIRVFYLIFLPWTLAPLAYGFAATMVLLVTGSDHLASSGYYVGPWTALISLLIGPFLGPFTLLGGMLFRPPWTLLLFVLFLWHSLVLCCALGIVLPSRSP